jgi:predicted Fe-S protein YdhL (DUF1289 family)
MTAFAPELAAPVPTPCIGLCKLDDRSGLCLGCARTADELAAWLETGDEHKRRVWAALPERRAGMALCVYRLPWSAGDIARMIERTLRRRSGCWTLGVEGASASFAIGRDGEADIVAMADGLTAITAHGALRLASHEKAVALALGNAADPAGPEAICLVLPRGRVTLGKGGAIGLGAPDSGAILAGGRATPLYDLGVTSGLAARFLLRTDDRCLAGFAGKPWREAKAALGTIAAHSVVETGLGRCEVFAPPAAQIADGPFATLDPARLDAPSELPPAWHVPPVFAPCALFYPARRRPAEALLDGAF